MKEKRNAFPLWFAILLVGFIFMMPIEKGIAQEQTPQQPQPSTDIREDFSDQELKAFLNAHKKVSEIQIENEAKIIKVIDDEGLSIDRFNEILQAQQDPQKKTETSPEDLSSFNNAAQIIIEENQKAEKRMTSSIEEEGIDIDTYQQIMLAYQQSPAVQSKVNELMNKED